MGILDFGRQVYQWVRPARAADTERSWRRFATRVTRRTFSAWLAEQVAEDMMQQKPYSLAIEEVSIAVLQAPASTLQHQAELFIEKYYFDYPFKHDEFLQYIATFRKLIQQNLLRLDAKTHAATCPGDATSSGIADDHA